MQSPVGGSVQPIDRASRINFGIHHPIQYNVKVKDLGMVPPEYMQRLLGYWQEEQLRGSFPSDSVTLYAPAALTYGSPTSIGTQGAWSYQSSNQAPSATTYEGSTPYSSQGKAGYKTKAHGSTSTYDTQMASGQTWDQPGEVIRRPIQDPAEPPPSFPRWYYH